MTRNSWLIAFADLTAVMCAFFVMMLAMSDFDAPALDRIATVFGKDEGSWIGERQSAVPAAAIRRVGEDGAPKRDYLAAVLTSRLDLADWPWTLQKRFDGVALLQTIPPNGPVLPVEMAEYIRSLGFPVRVATAMSAPSGKVTGTIGHYDEGLRTAALLADRLRRAGVAGAIPTSARFVEDNVPHRIEIILDSGLE